MVFIDPYDEVIMQFFTRGSKGSASSDNQKRRSEIETIYTTFDRIRQDLTETL